ncbi:hypothetical protein SCAR479_07666 [Seiridium cardinale]|uniref:Uncharacterized protein n=1 Tax=Seiridium cardinale TaxID=138064 RepID=A0ABR2XP34_9PEZI
MSTHTDNSKTMSADKKGIQSSAISVASEQSQSKPGAVGERAAYAHAGTDWEARNAQAGSTTEENRAQRGKKSWKHRLFKGPGLGIYG